MTSGQALLVYLGIPALAIAIIAICVYGASWFRKPASGADGAPVFVVSSPGIPNPGALPREIGSGSQIVAGGGASGRW